MSGKSSFGAVLEWYDAANGAWVAVGSVGDIDGPALELGTEDATTHDSPGGWEEKVPTTLSGGEVSFEIGWIPSSASHAWGEAGGLPYMAIQRQVQKFRLIPPDPDYTNKALEFNALVTKFKPKLPVKGKMQADVTLEITGPVTEVSTQ